MPKVSVIIPVYKAEKYISRAIESLLNQTLSDVEIIVVDDGSPDNSMAIVSDFADKNGNILIVDRQKNVGPMMARAKGWQMASGDYITFMDSDDTLPRNGLELLYDKITTTGVDMVFGCFCYIDIDGNQRTDSNLNGLKYGNDKIGTLKALLNREITQTLCNKIFKKELFQDFNYEIIENCTNGEDAAVLFQIVSNIKYIDVVNAAVYNYHENTQSSTHNHITSKAIESVCKTTLIREKILKPFEELRIDTNRYFTQNLTQYRTTKEGKRLLKQYGLFHYTTPLSIIKNIRFPESIKMLGKLFIR